MAKEKIITALDIGTTKICCLISIIDKNNKLKICGIGENKSEGLSQGMIKNIRAASDSMDKAIKEAEKMSGRDAQNVFIGVAGELIRSYVSHGITNIESKSRYSNELNDYEVTENEIKRVVEDAKKNKPISSDRRIIHAEPQFFTVDGIPGILDPIGMSGRRFEADVHIVTADINSLNNIYRCIQRIGLNVKDVVLQPIASSMAVLNRDERELGSILVDIGGGTTDISIYYKKSIRFSCIIPLGGEDITNDLAIGLRTPKVEAEKIKIEYGYARPDHADENIKIEIPGIGGRPATKRSQKFVAEIINPRIQKIADLTYNEINKSRYLKMITAGISITGGTANLRSTNQLFEDVFDLPTKTGYPSFAGIYGDTESLSDPKYATGVGLLYWGKKNFEKDPFNKNSKKSLIEKMISRIRDWFANQDFT